MGELDPGEAVVRKCGMMNAECRMGTEDSSAFPSMRDRIEIWLSAFDLDEFLRPHVADVFVALPEPVRDDLLEDPRFRLYDYEPGAGAMLVPVAAPARGQPGRSVVLKRS